MKKFNELREQYLEEKLKASDPAGTYIHDFVHSDNPKFAGKSKAKRIQMALAASYAAKGKSRNEETKQIDELSKTTLGSYVKNAAKDVGASRSLGANFANNAKKSRKPSSKSANSSLSDRFNAIAQKRHKGISKAVDRLSK